MNESFNLPEIVRERLTGDVIDRMSALLGEDSESTRARIDAAIPALLSGLDQAASTFDGACRINCAVEDADGGELSSVTGDSWSATLRSILGPEGFAELTANVGSVSGLSGTETSALLEMLAPIVFGVIKSVKQDIGADRFNVEGLLASQAIEDLERARPRTRWSSWFLALTLLVLGLMLIWYWIV